MECICSSAMLFLGAIVVVFAIVVTQNSRDVTKMQSSTVTEINKIIDETFNKIRQESNRYLSEIQKALKGE